MVLMTNENQTAEIIRQQLGHKALYILGARDLIATDRGLRFTIRGCQKANRIEITLDADDTYTVRVSRFSPARFNRRTMSFSAMKDTTVSNHEGVYVDSLHRVIESATGLYTSL
jgi:hypothetical protein